MEPGPAVIFQVTGRLEVSCWVWPEERLTVVGVMVRAGVRVIVAVPDLVVSAALVAVTVAVAGAVIVVGAVYLPFESIAPPPVTDQVTVWLVELTTVAMNVWVPV